MFPSDFDQSNKVLDRPPTMTADDCDPLNVWRGDDSEGIPVVISCWKFTKEELEIMQKTGKVWLIIRGTTMPPASISGMEIWPKET
mgnify:CR=1 FL=1